MIEIYQFIETCVVRLHVTAEHCLQRAVELCSYEARNLVLYRGFIGAMDYLCGPSRRGMLNDDDINTHVDRGLIL